MASPIRRVVGRGKPAALAPTPYAPLDPGTSEAPTPNVDAADGVPVADERDRLHETERLRESDVDDVVEVPDGAEASESEVDAVPSTQGTEPSPEEVANFIIAPIDAAATQLINSLPDDEADDRLGALIVPGCPDREFPHDRLVELITELITVLTGLTAAIEVVGQQQQWQTDTIAATMGQLDAVLANAGGNPIKLLSGVMGMMRKGQSNG